MEFRDFLQAKCEACRADAPLVTEEEKKKFLPLIPDWKIVQEGCEKLVREYRFANFAEALKFVIKVGELAELEGHHPRIILEWGKVELQWWTHKIKGLHLNDFIMAVKTDQILKTLLARDGTLR